MTTETAVGSRSDPSDAPLLEARAVEINFRGVRALRGVDLAVTPGEILALVGPNGSGKSTLINVLSGTFKPTSGRILFRGHDITRKSPHLISRLGLARTYQIPRPFPTMTVLENVALAAMFRSHAPGIIEATATARAFLDVTHLTAVADKLPTSINLQQRKFLELARALAAEPQLLMLDEVLTGLNPAEIEESISMIKKIHDGGVTIIIVEHLMRVVTTLATRMVVLASGEELAAGKPAEVMKIPEVVTAYLGRGDA